MSDGETLLAASLDFFTQDDDLRNRFKLMKPEAGFEEYIDIGIHSDGMIFGYHHLGSDGRDNTWDVLRITVADLAKAITESPEYHDEPVRLASCRAGKDPDGAAQHLADALGVRVRAADMDVYVDADGRYTLAESLEEA